MPKFLKVKRVDGDKFTFNLQTEPSFGLDEGFIEVKDWYKFLKVFVHSESKLTSYRIGPIDKSELEVINQ